VERNAEDTPGATAASDGLPAPQRAWAVAAIWLALAMAVLDGAIANVALPTIGRALHASRSGSIWVINAYQLAIVVALLPLAALGDRLGHRRVYTAGLVVFTAGSLACALSGTLAELTASRMLQGLGAAGVMSLNPAMVRAVYPRRLLGQGIGLNALVIAASSVVGPVTASAILAVGPWPWLFAVNLPVGVLAIAVGSFALPSTPRTGARLDLIAVGLNAAAFGGVILGVEKTAREGLASGGAILLAGLAAGAALVRRELSQTHPLLPLDLLRIRIFRLSIITSVASFAAQMLALVALPFALQSEMGRSAVATGALMTPSPLAVCVAAPIAGRLADRFPAGLLAGLGLATFAAGLLLLATLPTHASDLQFIWRMGVCGLGFGFFQAPNNRAIIDSAPHERSGAAGGLLATARLIGQTSGAVTVAVLFHATPRQATFIALSAASAIAAIAAGVSLLRLRPEQTKDRLALSEGPRAS
jgi:DHA2 family multidrug resistance protein-like MFS transporter